MRILATGTAGMLGSSLIPAVVRAGHDVVATDIDPFAHAATRLNAKANGVHLTVLRRDLLGEDPPTDIDVVLAGDCWYEPDLARRALSWLRRAQRAGIDVLTADPGRADLPTAVLEPVASYDVRTTSDLEDLGFRRAGVYRLIDPTPPA